MSAWTEHPAWPELQQAARDSGLTELLDREPRDTDTHWVWYPEQHGPGSRCLLMEKATA